MTYFKRTCSVAAALLSTVACAEPLAPHQYSVDYAGNVYPPQCRKNLSTLTARVPVVDVDSKTLAKIAGAHVYGVYFQMMGLKFIYLEKGLADWKREEILHHERCHAYLDILGLNPAWHK